MHPFVRARKAGPEGPEKTGTAPSSGAGLMPAPPPTLCSGL